MRINSFMDVLGLTVVAAIVGNIVTSRNTAGIVTASGNAWGKIISSSFGK